MTANCEASISPGSPTIMKLRPSTSIGVSGSCPAARCAATQRCRRGSTRSPRYFATRSLTESRSARALSHENACQRLLSSAARRSSQTPCCCSSTIQVQRSSPSRCQPAHSALTRDDGSPCCWQWSCGGCPGKVRILSQNAPLALSGRMRRSTRNRSLILCAAGVLGALAMGATAARAEPASEFKAVPSPSGYVIVVHAGGWRIVGRGMLGFEYPNVGRLNGWGYSTLNVDYRAGADGLTDLLRFHDGLRRRIGKARLCVLGTSSGGHLALMLALR